MFSCCSFCIGWGYGYNPITKYCVPIQDVAVKILKVQGFDSERFEEFLNEVFIFVFIDVHF